MIYKYSEDPDLSQVTIGDDVEVQLHDATDKQLRKLADDLQDALNRCPSGTALLTYAESWGTWKEPRTTYTFKFRDGEKLSFKDRGYVAVTIKGS